MIGGRPQDDSCRLQQPDSDHPHVVRSAPPTTPPSLAWRRIHLGHSFRTLLGTNDESIPPSRFPLTLLLGLIATTLAASSLSAAAPDSDSSIAQSLQPLVDSHALAGAVMLVADKDHILDVETVGYTDITAHKPMPADALFWIASMSKPMTATAVMMLVDEGKVNLDDRVEKYLPEFQGQMVAVKQDAGQVSLQKPVHPITIRNVLSHTSGLPFSSPIESPTLDLGPLSERVKSYAALPLRFQPDSKYEYSNAGINTAARILEVVSGMPYEQFMQQRLFDPLGMSDTTFWPSEQQLARLAHTYKPNADRTDLEEMAITQLKYPLNDRASRFPMPAGGLFSTAGDVAKFCQMLLSGGTLSGKQYVTSAALKEMTRKQTAAAIKDGYGLGWAVGTDWFGHGGAYATNMTVDLRHGLITVFMVQHAGFPKDGGTSEGVFRRLAHEKYGKPAAVQPK